MAECFPFEPLAVSIYDHSSEGEVYTDSWLTCPGHAAANMAETRWLSWLLVKGAQPLNKWHNWTSRHLKAGGGGSCEMVMAFEIRVNLDSSPHSTVS